MLTVASPRSNWVPSLRGPQKCAFPHLRFYPCCVLAWNLPLPLSAGLSLQGLLEFYSYLWCRRHISPHPSLLQKPGRERERERCGLSPVSCESQVLSPLDSTNEEPCWGLEGGDQGEARASPPFRFPFRGASCSSRVSSSPLSLRFPPGNSIVLRVASVPASSLCLPGLGAAVSSRYLSISRLPPCLASGFVFPPSSLTKSLYSAPSVGNAQAS